MTDGEPNDRFSRYTLSINEDPLPHLVYSGRIDIQIGPYFRFYSDAERWHKYIVAEYAGQWQRLFDDIFTGNIRETYADMRELE